MTAAEFTDEKLLRHPGRHPHLKQRIKGLVQVVEDAGGELTWADAAKRRVIEEIRRMGRVGS